MSEQQDPVNEWLARYRVGNQADKRNAPPVRCVDGFRISIQASRHHGCIPKKNSGPYTDVEVGNPSAPHPLLPPNEWNVWPWMPVKEVNQILADHGGIDPDYHPLIWAKLDELGRPTGERFAEVPMQTTGEPTPGFYYIGDMSDEEFEEFYEGCHADWRAKG